MSLVVEDGSGRADANVYLSAVDADIYHLARGNRAWEEAEHDRRGAALIAATAWLDGRWGGRFTGRRCRADQALAWPRAGACDADGFAVDAGAVPAAIRHATAELALRALIAPLGPDVERGGLVAAEAVGPLSVSYRPGAPAGTAFPFVEALLARLTGGAGVPVVRG